MVGAIIVRTIRNDYREIVSSLPGLREMIRRCLRGRIRRARVVGRLFSEEPIFSKRAIDLVCRDVEETKGVLGWGFESHPIVARRLKQRECSDDVGLDKIRRAGN